MPKKIEVPSQNQQEMQEKILLYQVLKGNLEQLVQQSSLLEKRFMELEVTKQTIRDLDKLKEGSEILVPLGSGCYSEGKVTVSKKILIDIGAGVTVFKDPKEIQEDLGSKTKELEDASKGLQEEMNKNVAKMNEFSPEIQKLIQKHG